MDSATIWRYLSARRLKVPAKDKLVRYSTKDQPSRVETIDAKLAELRGEQRAA